MLDATTMAADIDAAITDKANNPIFKAKAAAGIDVSKEIWEVICAQIIKHIKNDMEITIEIPELQVKKGTSIGNWELDTNGVLQPIKLAETLYDGTENITKPKTITTKTIN